MRLHCIELPVPSPDEAGRWLNPFCIFYPSATAGFMSAEIAVCASSPPRGTRRPARRTRSSGLSTSPLRPRMPVPFCVRCFQKVSSLSTTEVFPFLTRRFSEPEQNISI